MMLRTGLALAFSVASLGAHAQPVTLHHVHGLAYSADGKRLMIPSHHGLAVYENGKWSKAPGPQHDYMGFAATANSLYSSGHPAHGSGLVNPFGLIRSRDGGRTWDKLGLEGESDFHLLATSWNTTAIYVWNPAPSSRMRSPGLHHTLNDGFSWKPARAAGLDFDLDGKQLWYGTFNDAARLLRETLTGGAAVDVKLPPLGRDAVAYIAQNPARRNEYAIASFERSVFLSTDEGRSWKQIAARGTTK